MTGNVQLPDQVAVTSAATEGPVSSRQAHQEALEQLRTQRDLLDRERVALTEWKVRCQAMDVWTGGTVPEAALQVLFSTQLPLVLTRGVAAQRDRQSVADACAKELQADMAQRRDITTQFADLQIRYASEHEASKARITALEGLLPVAEQIISLRARLHEAQLRHREQSRPTFRGLWKTLSGQASATVQDIRYLEGKLDALVRDFRVQGHAHASLQGVRPEHVASSLNHERQIQLDLNALENRERLSLQERVERLNEAEARTRARLSEAEAAAEVLWHEAQRHHQVPDWTVWEHLWASRAQGAELWRSREDAAARLREVNDELERIWSEWPEAERNVDAFRRRLADTAAALRAQEAQQERERHQADLRQSVLNAPAAQLAESSAVKMVAEGESGATSDRQPADVPITGSSSSSRPSQLQPLHPVQPHRPATQKASGQESVTVKQEETGQAPSAEGMPETMAPSSRAAEYWSRAGKPAGGSGDVATERRPTQALPVLAAEQRVEAQRLLVRHASFAAQAAMCLEALQEWSGPGVDAAQLAALVSRPLPAELEWTTRPGQVNLRLSQDGPVSPSFGELQVRYGLPAEHRWASVWTDRMKGVTLLERWKSARDGLTQQEARMAELWTAWPAALQNVDSLRSLTQEAQAPRQLQDKAMPATNAGGDRPIRVTPGRVTAATPTSAGLPPAALPRPISSREQASSVQRPPVTPPLPGRPEQPQSPPVTPAPLAPLEKPAPAVASTLSAPARQSSAVQVAAEQSERPPQTVIDALTRDMERAEVLLHTYERVQARLAMCPEGLTSWAGPDVDGLQLGKFMSRPLPPEVETALNRWQNEQRDQTRPILAGTDADRQAIQDAVEAERRRAAERLGPLRLLHLQAPALIAAEREHYLATSANRRRRASRLAAAQDTYAEQARALGFSSPPPPPRDLSVMIQREEQEFARRMAPLEAAWQAIIQPGSEQPETPAPPRSQAAPRSLVTAVKAWRKVSARYGLPDEPEQFETLWRQRQHGANLWADWTAAQDDKTLVEAGLNELWLDWPAAFRSLTGLEKALRAARQVQRDAAQERRAAASQSARAGDPVLKRPPPAPWNRSPTTAVGLATRHEERPVPGPPAPQVPPVPPMPAGTRRDTVMSPPSMPPATSPSRPPERRTGPGQLERAARERPEQPDQVGLSGPPPLPRLSGGQPAPPLPATRPAQVRPPLPGRPGQPRPGAPPAPTGPLESPAHSKVPGRLSQRGRAEREAVRISEQYSWARGFLMLADALDRENWGQLRQRIEREIACGMTPEEFELVLQLRAYWHEQLHFQSPYSARHDSLPWSLALELIRRTSGVPCLEEMIVMIERLYDHAEVACSRRALPAFSQRLGVLLAEAEPGVDLDYWICVLEARCSSP